MCSEQLRHKREHKRPDTADIKKEKQYCKQVRLESSELLRQKIKQRRFDS